MSNPILLLSGIPGTGKSSFARWLANNERYLHVDFDHDGLRKNGLEDLFDKFASSNSDEFVAKLLSLDSPVCLDWGFPPKCVWIVQRLLDTGVQVWWFDAAPTIAKKHFLQRCDVSESAFDEQLANITAARDSIMKVFGEHVIVAIDEGGAHLRCEEIYKLMFR